MILTTTRHGRTRRDTRYLLAHLSRQTGQRARVVSLAAPVATASEALDYMQAMRDGSRASVAYHHISLSPSVPMTDDQRDEAVARVLAAFGAEDHAHVVWEHAGKARRGADVDTHFHIVLSHVGPSGRALDDGRSFVRLEAVARTLEVDFGHPLTPSRRTAAVAAELDRTGRPDIAALVRGEAPLDEPPQAAMSSRQRARAERHGISLPDVRVAVRAAWTASDSPAALRAALAEQGLGIVRGDKPDVWVVTTADGQTFGALDRLSGQRRRTVQARMEETPTDDPTDPARHARPARDLRRSPREPRSGASPDPAADAARSRTTGRRVPDGRSDGTSARRPGGTGADASGDRGVGRSPRRRAQEALAVAALARAARDEGTQRELRRFQRLHRPKGRDVLDVRRLARVDLDELRRWSQDLGKRLAAFLTRVSQPPAPPLLPSRPEPRPHAALRARLRDAAATPRRAEPVPCPDEDDEPARAYRPPHVRRIP